MERLRFKWWKQGVALPTTPIPYSIFIVPNGTTFEMFPVDANGNYLNNTVVDVGVEGITGDGVDNTDPTNPILSFPNADEVDDTLTTNKFVSQAHIDLILSALQPGDSLSELVNDVGYLTTETDPIFTAHTASNIVNGTGLLKNDGVGNWSYDNSTYLTTISGLSHTLLSNVGVNTHAQIDSHIANSSTHFTMGSISITESQISDLQSYLTTEVNDLTQAVVWDNVPDANITQSSVVQHQAALTITESQISDLNHFTPSTLLADYGFTDNSTNWNTAYSWGNHAGLYSLLGHTHTFSSLTSKPTTLAGYGITDTYTKTESESRYVNVTGDTMTGDLTAPNFIGNGSGLTDVDAVNLGGQPASYYDFRDYGLGSNAIPISDFDAVSQTGFYYNPGSNATGAPSSISSLNLIHININSNSATQIVNRVGANQQWYRRKSGGVWQPWVEIWHSGNFTPTDYLNKTTGGTITGTTLYDKTIAEQESASVKTVVNREFVEDYVANNAGLPVGFYEEGTFTPQLKAGSYLYNPTTLNQGYYVRNGNQVTISIRIVNINDATDITGFLNIDLPLPANVNGPEGDINVKQVSAIGFSFPYSMYARLSSNSILLRDPNTQSNLTNVSFSGGSIYISGTYITNVYTP